MTHSTPDLTGPNGNDARRPTLLDLFCGAGGASVGYHLAGFDVVGVDINPQPNYPFEFHQADALTFPLDGFDAIHASPPCQAYTGVPGRRSDHPELLAPIRERLIEAGVPYVIENVPGAPMPSALVLCGSAFGLPIVRHRQFEVEPMMLIEPQCAAKSYGRATYHGPQFCAYGHGAWRPRWRAEVVPVVWPWMTLEEAGQAIPPPYTELIGCHLIHHLLMVRSGRVGDAR